MISMFVATANSENNCGNFMTWLKVILGSYIADLLVGLNLLMQVQKTRKDNIYLMVFSILSCCSTLLGSVMATTSTLILVPVISLVILLGTNPLELFPNKKILF